MPSFLPFFGLALPFFSLLFFSDFLILFLTGLDEAALSLEQAALSQERKRDCEQALGCFGACPEPEPAPLLAGEWFLWRPVSHSVLLTLLRFLGPPRISLTSWLVVLASMRPSFTM